MAQALRIQWHVLADGDRSGLAYGESARRHLGSDPLAERLTLLHEKDIEHCFWSHGFDTVYRHAAGAPPAASGTPHKVIDRAIGRHSKPGLAFAILAEVAARGPASIPPPLAGVIETCVRLARESPRRAVAGDRHETIERRPKKGDKNHPHHRRHEA